jgi:hypothetical protein
MINFIKTAVSKTISPNQSELHSAVACTIFTLMQEEIVVTFNESEIFDLIVLTKIIRKKFLEWSGKELSESNPLDYAELYSKFGGNPLVFLNNYQNYLGPIE